MGTQRFSGTQTTSAWEAKPAPATATRSPGLKPVTPAPTSSTTPGGAVAQGDRLIQAVHGLFEDADKALFLALAQAWRTRSGRARALPNRLFWPISIISFSVPGLMREATFRTSTPPALHRGSGTSRR